MTASFASRSAWVLGVAVMTACSAGDESAEAEATLDAAQTPAVEQAEVSGQGTLDEARAMLDLAVAHYEEVGRDQALQDFTNQTAPFVDRDLYVFCYGPDRLVSAHGADASIVGDPVDELEDVDGFAFGPAIMETAAANPDGGRVNYKWLNPTTGGVEPKVSFVQSVGDDVCGVGAYGEAP